MRLLILPGWGGSRETWKEFTYLAKKKIPDLEIEVLDLPCFGTEPCPKTVWGVEEYSEFVSQKIICQSANLLDITKIDQFNNCSITKFKKKPILLGHSFGGQVAAQLAATHPELIEKLILVGAAIIRPKHQIRRLFFGGLAKVGKWIISLPFLKPLYWPAQKFLYRLADSPDYTQTVGLQRDIYKKIIRQDISHQLPFISVPTLVIWGAKDKVTPLRLGKKIVQTIPRACLRIIQHGRHGLHQERAEEFIAAIIAFL